MSRPKSLKPKHCHHKASGQSFVRLNGQMVYTGRWGTQESKDNYDRIIDEWIAAGRQWAIAPTPQGDDSDELTIVRLCAAFMDYATSFYRRSSEAENYKLAIKPLRRLYGKTPAGKFGPMRFRAVRDEMVRLG